MNVFVCYAIILPKFGRRNRFKYFKGKIKTKVITFQKGQQKYQIFSWKSSIAELLDPLIFLYKA